MKLKFQSLLLTVIIVLSSIQLSVAASAINNSLDISKGETYTLTLSGDYSKNIHNEGDLIIIGEGTLYGEIENCGGNLTISGEKIYIYNMNGISNSDYGTVTVKGARTFGANRAFINEEGCTLVLSNGASFSCEAFMYSALTNYGTVNADNFQAGGYQGSIDNEGTINLKNGTISTQYSVPIGTSGNAYIENCTISAGSYGGSGGISGSGTLTIKDSKISLGTSRYTVGLGFRGNLTVDNCNISASYGIILTEGTATITNSSVSGTDSQGGYAISNFSECIMTIDKCDLYGTEGLVNSGTVTVRSSTIKSTNNWIGNEKAISNSGTLYCNNSTVKSSFTAYEGNNGTAEFKGCSIQGFNFSWDYDPMDLYGDETTFLMTNGTVKLFDCILPGGFYVLTDENAEKQYVLKDLIADDHTLYSADDNSAVELDETTTMLDGAYYIEADEKLPDFGASIADLNEGNVTSDNLEVINSELALANEYNAEDYSEEIAAKITQTKEKCNALLNVIASVKAKADNIIDFASKTTADKLTTDAIAEIDSVAAQADALLESNNLTSSERSDIEEAKANLEKIKSELAKRKADIEAVLENAKKITDKPTTADEEALNALTKDIEALLTLELTEDEHAKLETTKETVLTSLEQIHKVQDDLAELKAEFDSIKRERVNIFDKDYLENLSERIGLLINEGTLAAETLEDAQNLESNVQSLIELIQTPLFYGIIRIFWTIVAMIKTIIL